MPCTNHGIKCDGTECVNKNLDNGLMTRLWGPSGWLFLHCITFGYPYKIDPTNPEHLEKQNDYYRFFYYVGKTLPCKYCRDSYMEFLIKTNLMSSLGTRKELTKWLFDIHNLVNDKLGVPACERPSFEELEDRYQSFRAACKPLTETQRNNNASKGCVAPADGKPKRSVIKVVEYDTITTTPTTNTTNTTNTTPTTNTTNTSPNTKSTSNVAHYPKSDDYFVLHKNTTYFVIITLIILIICYSSWKLSKQKIKMLM